jgi:protein TIF31
LNNVSPLFKKNFILIQKQRSSKHPFERISTPFQVNTWLSPDFDHKCDWFRAEDSNAAKLGHEDHIPGHTRDWNEELQATKELPNKTLPERLIRERAMFKVHSDFVNAATRGAIAVVENNIMAINPGEDSKIQMFIWNNMFFSYGFDVKDHYKVIYDSLQTKLIIFEKNFDLTKKKGFRR